MVPEGLDAGGVPEPARPARRAPVSRTRVVTRLWRTAERQVAEIECRITAISDDPLAFERDTKMLAIIAKTVRDLVAIDAEAFEQAERSRQKEKRIRHGSKTAAPEAAAGEDAQANDPGPRDIEEFRAELARRLDELRHERGGGEAS